MLIVAAGLFNLAFALFHLFFWRLFDWPQELARLGAVNRGIAQVLNLCLTYLFAVAAAVLLLLPSAAFGTDLGRFFLFAWTGFWLLRAFLQPMFFGLEHRLSAALFGVFILGSVIHGWAWWGVRYI